VKKLLKKLLEDGGKADKRLADLKKLENANRDQDFTGPMPDWKAELKKQLPDVRYTTDESPPRKKFTRSTIDKFLATPEVREGIEALDADWKRRGEESRLSLLKAIEIMRAAAKEHRDFGSTEEKAAGELREAFAPGTDLGDLLLIACDDEDALNRFVERHPQPIHRARWAKFRRELEEELRHRMAPCGVSREEVLRDVARFASLHAAERVLSQGWDTRTRRGPDAKKKPSRTARKPIEKPVDLGGGFTVIFREPTPLELIDVLSGDVATLDERILRASIVGAGGWRATSAEDVDAFLREGHYSPGELALLLREARAFVAECLLSARDATLYEMGQAAFADLSGGRTRSEMVKDRRTDPEPEIALSRGLEGLEKYDGLEMDLIAWEAEKKLISSLRCLKDGLSARDQTIIEARCEGRNLKEIAAELGISHAAARQAWSRITRKAVRLP